MERQQAIATTVPARQTTCVVFHKQTHRYKVAMQRQSHQATDNQTSTLPPHSLCHELCKNR